MIDSSIDNKSSGDNKRKITPPDWFHNSDLFEGNNAISISKVDQGSSNVLGSKMSTGVIDLTLDMDEEDPLTLKEQQVVNVDFIRRDYWFVDKQQEKAVDFKILVSTYMYAAKSRSLCSEATIKRIQFHGENTDELFAIDKGCILRLDEDIEIIEKAKSRLQKLCDQEDEVFNVARQQWKETESNHKVSKAANVALKSYIVHNKSHLSSLRSSIIKHQAKLNKLSCVPEVKTKVYVMKHFHKNSSILASSSDSVDLDEEPNSCGSELESVDEDLIPAKDGQIL